MQNVLASVGGGGAQNQARMFVILKPLNERKGVSADMVINRLRPKLSHIPGRQRCICRPCRTCRSAAHGSNAQYQYTLSGENLKELYEWAPQPDREAARHSRS